MRTKLTGLWVTALLAAFAMLWSSPAQATIHEHLVERCVGDAAYRCAWLNYDDVNDRVRGYADIVRTGEWLVAVNNLRLQFSADPDGPWSTLSQVDDFDGYDTRDAASTGLGICARVYYRVVYHWSARHSNGNTASGDERSDALWCAP